MRRLARPDPGGGELRTMLRRGASCIVVRCCSRGHFFKTINLKAPPINYSFFFPTFAKMLVTLNWTLISPSPIIYVAIYKLYLKLFYLCYQKICVDIGPFISDFTKPIVIVKQTIPTLDRL